MGFPRLCNPTWKRFGTEKVGREFNVEMKKQ
jgi:hypothetical protein